MPPTWDAIVVGSGPNGLSAAVELARSGYGVCVLEAEDTIGGGMRTRELTLPGFWHDECSAIHPMGILSPVFRRFPLSEHGLEWVPFRASVAHPLDDGPAPILYQSLERTTERLGPDGPQWQRLLEPFLRHPHDLLADLMAPLHLRLKRPWLAARFGWYARLSALRLAQEWFAATPTQALFAGCAGHAVLPLDMRFTAALGLIFSITAHVENWPCARGGSAAIAQALASYLQLLGGHIEVGQRVQSLAELASARVVLFDLAPKPFVGLAREGLPSRYCQRLLRYRYGLGTFKLDWALDGPIPWRDPAVGEASTVHVGGTLAEIAASEREAWDGGHHERPYLILCQQSHADPSRAPAGQHTGYAYCHVPNGSGYDMTDRIETQIERFAPGFRDRILARHLTRPRDFERLNPNYVGGAVTGGAGDIRQMFTRPVARLNPYTTPNRRLFLCSASTPPGGGVHGVCGYYAARAAIRHLRRGSSQSLN